MRLPYAIPALTGVLAACAAGCSNTAATSPQAAPANAQIDQNSGNSGAGSATGRGNGAKIISANDKSPIGQAASADFDGWCLKAGETEVVQKSLGQLYGELCDQSGKATSLFTATLINVAYDGSGDPSLKFIKPLSSDSNANTTTAYFGVGIKLPISAQQHFDVVGPKEGTGDAQSKLAAAQGAHQDAINITPDNSTDKFFVRGWTIHSTTSQQTGIIKLVTETVNNNDEYELQKGSLYMYTTVTTQGLQTVKEFSLLTAGIEVNGTGYLVTIAHLVVGDFGLHDLAQSKITGTAAGLIKSMYQAAAEGKGVADPNAGGSGGAGNGPGGTANNGGTNATNTNATTNGTSSTNGGNPGSG